MDAARWSQVSALLDELLDLEVEARTVRLAQLATGDADLAADVSRLLALEAARADFLGEPLLPAAPEPDAAGADGPRAGDRVGPYDLLRLLGEGGMGRVWLAARADGLYQREVALKLLRADGPAPALRARFARERQILAQLSHPNIARLFDAGVDADGRPYLALEYVEGETLLAHAQRRGLGIAARIALFLQVCDAVAYAHGRLVVHRDLKPSNILVTGSDEVRLLDFGIAKLLDEEMPGSETELTRFAGRAYSVHYAAPEQIRGEAVSTQTDVYALGVVLYELLTGHRPYRLRRGSAAEVEDAVLAAEPRRPSQVVLRREDEVAGEHTATLPPRDAKLRARALAGDLDNILLHALRKAPEARYASVEAFAKDLRRHLAGHPVSARPDRFGYRAAKFVRRNVLALGLASAALLLLLLGSALVFVQGQRALAEAQRAQAIQDFMLGLFERTDPNIAQRGDLSVATLLRDGARRAREELRGQPAVQRELLLMIAGLQNGFGRYDEALGLVDGLGGDAADAPDEMRLRRAIERARALRGLARIGDCVAALDAAAPAEAGLGDAQPLLRAHYQAMRGRCHRMDNDPQAARTAFERALALRTAHGATPLLVSELMTDLAALAADRGEYAEAIAQMRAALAHLDARGGSTNIMGVHLWRSLGALHRDRGDPVAARAAFDRAIDIAQRLYPDGHPALAETRRQLAATLIDEGRLDEAEPLLAQVLEYQRRTLGAQHPDVAASYNSQAILAWRRGDRARAVARLEQAVALWRGSEREGPLAGGLHNLGMVLLDGGDAARAEPLLREALALREAAFGRDDASVATTLRLLAEIALATERFDQAASQLARALAIQRRHHGDAHPQTAHVQVSLARLDFARGDAAAGDARIAQLLAALPPDDAERQRVRSQALLLQAGARCRRGEAAIGRAQLEDVRRDHGADGDLRGPMERARALCAG